MPHGSMKGLSELQAARVHKIITNTETTLKPYENVVVLVSSSDKFDVKLPHPAEAEDRWFSFHLPTKASSSGVTIKKPSAGSSYTDAVGDALAWTGNRALLYCDGYDYFAVIHTTSSS